MRPDTIVEAVPSFNDEDDVTDKEDSVEDEGTPVCVHVCTAV